MIDPITQYILELDHKESINFDGTLTNKFKYARGFPKGKQANAIFKKENAICNKMDDNAKSKEENIKAWKCGINAMRKLIFIANNILKTEGIKYCQKYDGEKKKICLDKIKRTIGSHNHELRKQLESYKANF